MPQGAGLTLTSAFRSTGFSKPLQSSIHVRSAAPCAPFLVTCATGKGGTLRRPNTATKPGSSAAPRGRGGPTRPGTCPPERRPVPQLRFEGHFPQNPIVAIVGGGLSGLCCALELAHQGVRSVVFDTGEHGVGGRLATRSAADGSLHSPAAAAPGLAFDHAAQYFTASDPHFAELVQGWQRAGAVEQWNGRVGVLHLGGTFNPLADTSGARFVGVGGMRALAEHISSCAVDTGLVEIRRPQWVNRAKAVNGRWQLTARGKSQGGFDCCVIAHNGKCANRLTAPMGVPEVHKQLRRLKLSANWVVMAAFASPVPVPGGLEGAFVRGSEVLSWAGNNSAKLGLPAGTPECWTLVSTQKFGRSNKVPQENTPPEVAAQVEAELLAAFEAALGLTPGALPPLVYSRAQLWGAALPLNSPAVPCIWDGAGRVGVVGDWVSGGGSMQAAALSGRALAQRIAAMRGGSPAEAAQFTLGLATPFIPAGGEDMGQFPSAPPAPLQPNL